MNTQAIPPVGPLLARMPSGREIHSLKPYQPPLLEREVLEGMRAPPTRPDDFGNDLSSDDEGKADAPMPVGAFPGTNREYVGSSSAYY
jgi:hypothetical protein